MKEKKDSLGEMIERSDTLPTYESINNTIGHLFVCP